MKPTTITKSSWSTTTASSPAMLLAPAGSDSSLFLPQGLEPRYAYPMIVCLEQSTAGPTRFLEKMEAISDRNYLGVQVSPPDLARLPAAELQACIEQAVHTAAAHANVHGERIFLLGSGEFGQVALRHTFEYPERFAGFLALQPTDWAPLPRLRNFRQMHHLRGLLAVSRPRLTPLELAAAEILHAAGIDLRLQVELAAGERSDSQLINHFLMQGILRHSRAA